jgi:hypothetical protein
VLAGIALLSFSPLPVASIVFIVFGERGFDRGEPALNDAIKTIGD